MTTYRHTQFGRVLVYGMSAMVLLLGLAGFALGTLRWMLPPMVLLALAALLFGWLRTEIRGGMLHCRFGPGLFHKRFPLREIESVRPVRNSWIWGWGIRYTPHGWLYNVSGLDGVELTLSNGRRARVGTDRPEELVRALEQAIAVLEPR
jgi:hypothetical protein